MVSSLLGLSFWNYITILFDNVVKMFYWLYAAIASAVDMLQCIVRKLAGLDVYYVDGTAYAQQDPVLEFIYGILGIGDNASAYGALNTVFWSLAIFGLIVLVLSTVVAIIKAHYSNDGSATNPMTYIFTMIKSVLTFAIVPLAVILGVQISQFLLQTLDSITASSSTYETLSGIYGSTAVNEFVGGTLDGDNTKYYNRYDFFGLGSYCSSTTFSGMVFKAAAYDANRLRMGYYTVSSFPNYRNIFGQTSPTSSEMTTEDWIAYQVDYAFSNNLNVSGAIWAEQLMVLTDDAYMVYSGGLNFYALVGVSDGFSKFNVGLVWFYYDLWNFNFLVGFISITFCIGIFLNIIFGLISRIIKSAALFLIFPATLGTAPLDDFAMFKRWRTEFMQQILMTYGAVIGMNVLFLILPYMDEISLFNGWYYEPINYIIRVLFSVTGVIMVNEFIKFFSTLVGGADANAVGKGYKDAVKGEFKKGADLAMSVAGVAAQVALPGAGTAVRAGVNAIKTSSAKKKANSLQADAAAETAGITSTEESRVNDMMAAKNANDQMLRGTGLNPTQAAAMNKAATLAKNKAIASGETDPEALKEIEKNAKQSWLRENVTAYKENEGTIAREGYTQDELDHKQKAEQLSNQAKQVAAANYLSQDDSGNWTGAGRLKVKAKNHMQEAMGSIMKGLEEGLKVSGINTNSIMDTLHHANTKKYNKEGEEVGDYVKGYISGEDFVAGRRKANDVKEGEGDKAHWRRATSEEKTSAKDIGKAVANSVGQVLGVVSMPKTNHNPPPTKPSDQAKMNDQLKRINETEQAMLKTLEKLYRKP